MMNGAGRAMLRPLGAAALLIGVEGVHVALSSWDLFVTPGERARYLLALVSGAVALCVVGWALGSAVVRLCDAGARGGRGASRRLFFAASVVAAPVLFAMLYSLTAGRRLRDLPARALLVAVVALIGAASFGALASWLRERQRDAPPARRRVAGAFLLGTVVLTLADGLVLPRLYPALHLGLSTAAVGCALAMSSALPARPAPTGPRHALGWVAVLGLLAAPFALDALRSSPNASFVVEARAQITGKLVAALRAAAPDTLPTGAPPPARVAPPARRGIDLGDHDVLLVTVDALRADRLAAYGGRGLTPHMDRLAAEGAVFRRAYTPTPHTSYALTSLLTGKFLRPVLELPDAPTEHPTMPELMRRYGYRTAAFYPPAIFHVDGHRFEAMADARFGFEYSKQMYAPAHRRVDQLREYLAAAPRDRPVFVWVHLFEPHEPYDPPPEFASGGSVEDRYDGEVATADDAFGQLVRVFRRARPGATVILSADHGEELGDHGGHYHGTTLYDEQVRIPLVWSSPGIVAPSVVDAPVELVDVAVTLLSALGIPRDARMRGDDLGPALLGDRTAGPEYAFAGIDDLRMLTDGRYKLICRAGERGCLLYDLVVDPGERASVAADHPEVVERLRSALGAFIGEIPRIEAMAMGRGVGWPAVLARAELGDPTVGPAVVPLLGDRRAPVRAAAARAIGDLAHAPAAPTVSRMRQHDEDAAVRAEAAIAALRLGDEAATGDVRAVAVEPGDSIDRSRRAALALSHVGDAAGVPTLLSLAADEAASEREREAAIEALGRLGSREAVDPLCALLEDVRLRIHAAGALGRIGDRRAGAALAAALERERYLPARRAEAWSLVRLSDRRAEPLVVFFLGMETPIPDGVAILLELGALARPSGRGADLRTAESVRAGPWACDAMGCAPGEGAAVELPRRGAPRGPASAVVRAFADEEGAGLEIDGEPLRLRRGVQEVRLLLPATREPRRLAFAAAPAVRVQAIAIVEARPELPAPEPEPWDAGPADAGR